jgi:hypothetical protein
VQPPAIQRDDGVPLIGARVTVYSRTLHRACEILGGLDRLARHLGVPRAALARWIDGSEEPPLKIFLAAVDIVLLGAEPGSGTG